MMNMKKIAVAVAAILPCSVFAGVTPPTQVPEPGMLPLFIGAAVIAYVLKKKK